MGENLDLFDKIKWSSFICLAGKIKQQQTIDFAILSTEKANCGKCWTYNNISFTNANSNYMKRSFRQVVDL